MTIRQFRTGTRADWIERLVEDEYDGTRLVVAVEVFDDNTSRYDETLDATIGPWVVGSADEVYAWLSAVGSEDHTEQYSSPQPAPMTVEVNLPDGTSARWEAVYGEHEADVLLEAIRNLLGEPATTKV